MPPPGRLATQLRPALTVLYLIFNDARSPARTGRDGALIPLAEQDRSRWDGRAIAEGTALITRSLTATRVGPYQLQAAIAAVHLLDLAGDRDAARSCYLWAPRRTLSVPEQRYLAARAARLTTER